ncbi:hypothetical protein BaRGS_00012770 [Batillaria attramentaria]|uniref:Secreted protein n=1 Tax=Batillaria attramentaria TaxID=370345 RepID=A0ABD0L9J4_9CAEN
MVSGLLFQFLLMPIVQRFALSDHRCNTRLLLVPVFARPPNVSGQCHGRRKRHERPRVVITDDPDSVSITFMVFVETAYNAESCSEKTVFKKCFNMMATLSWVIETASQLTTEHLCTTCRETSSTDRKGRLCVRLLV